MRCKSFGLFLSVVTALAAMSASCVLLCFSFSLFSAEDYMLGGGRKTYAFGSSSSNAVFVNEDDFSGGAVFVGYKAVSVYYSDKSVDRVIAEIVDELSPTEVFSEYADGVRCYYFYSEKIPFYKVLYVGDRAFSQEESASACRREGSPTEPSVASRFFPSAIKVNIHVAVSECGVTVGCPMIYCGY